MRGNGTHRDVGGLLWFYGVTIAATWLCYAPPVVAARRGEPFDPGLTGLFALGGILAPALTACALAALRGGRRELRDLLGMALRGRFPLRWYLVVVAVPFAVPLAAVALDGLLAGAVPAVWAVAPTAQTLATFWIAPIGEDLGWRGYALSRILALGGPMTASLVHGVLWALWHLPMFFIPGTAQADQSLPLFIVQLVGASMLFTRVFLATGGSVLAMMLMHAAANLAFNTVPVFAGEGGNGTRTALMSLLYLAVGVAALARRPRAGGAVRAGALAPTAR
ncbi:MULTISPECIES: CPBP family intramembrane glutamic endopeptidase [Thermomonospora]|uniref:Abortive infection protein n=1 Tax=Thermomonospora curvata (strain ATCC 19995 / DSM 43183 / JCM 3096 / KCTC 9072 / NBRC 15933 / NCIMB 10081 / Henssen B9) TaxID=471852 RepID=D1A3T1_THECD|nr:MULTISPECIES: CPBP family intramembrane glutamic endopeptidase [Thermomonospora]ACY97984.1 Abortive infection protein [Thermomonospora curvata DSM 43183]PKK14262.1 MAG: CPBP family intramembrane metalloprotease [Thermomonospora sp. CIF 1]